MALISNGTTVASGGSVTISSSAVATATASISVGAVGSYATLYRDFWSNSNQGTTFNSNLYFSNANAGHNNTTPSGTWRLMGSTQNASTGRANTSVMLRIS